MYDAQCRLKLWLLRSNAVFLNVAEVIENLEFRNIECKIDPSSKWLQITDHRLVSLLTPLSAPPLSCCHRRLSLVTGKLLCLPGVCPWLITNCQTK